MIFDVAESKTFPVDNAVDLPGNPERKYNELEKTLDDTIGLCRVSLEQYNRIVENPDANWAMRLFRFEPRERF